jgi:hypothetical protein
MATRMQQRRGTASQWTSANPVLNAGEIGWESDTNKFKIGDGTNHWADLDYFADTNSTVVPTFGTSIVFEGATADSYETTLLATDPTADRTITLPNATGTVVLADGSGNVTVSGNLTVQGTTTTIDSSTINVVNSFVFEGATADAYETTLTVTDPTADRTLTLPDATDTLVGRATTDTLTNKSISLTSNTITATLAELNTAISDADLASLAGSETLSNKTLASAVATTALTLNATAELRLADTDSSHYVGFKSPGTVTTNRIWTLPSADGSANQVLATDGSGILSWSTPAAGADEMLVLMGAY